MDAEEDLVRRSRAGDHLAFARLVDMHQMIARRVATTMIDPADADDVVQDAFVKAYTRLDQFRDGHRFQAWLLAIVANEARNRHRAAGRRAAVTLRVASEEGRSDDDGVVASDPERAHEAGAQRQRLADAVAALPERDREVVALRYFAELSEAEAAAALDVPVGTVKSRLSRALVRLRTTLAEEVPT